jgi:hypothetical protein
VKFTQKLAKSRCRGKQHDNKISDVFSIYAQPNFLESILLLFITDILLQLFPEAEHHSGTSMFLGTMLECNM